MCTKVSEKLLQIYTERAADTAETHALMIDAYVEYVSNAFCMEDEAAVRSSVEELFKYAAS